MCGIAGAVGIPRHIAEPALERMRRALRHRGPDDQDTRFVSSSASPNTVGLAHTRLAVIETSRAGRQPMRAIDAERWIAFNGEIYNFVQLRRELEQAGAEFRSRTDTETILAAYAAWGDKAASKLSGMFAFALADADAGRVWLCRDRVGIKPLYVARPASGGLMFASEVRTLLAAGSELVPPHISSTAIETFLAQGMVCGEHSIIDGIDLLPPGTTLVLDWDGKEVERKRYWELPVNDAPHVWRSRADCIVELETTLAAAVTSHLVSDVPLGVFLSSGIDSSSVASLAMSSATNVRTLAIGFDEPTHDESATAAKIARELRTEHRTVHLSGDEMLSDIGEVFAAVDQPTVDGFNTYFVSRAARRAGLTVALSGVGGDELFGGYHTFRDVPRALALSRFAHRHLGRTVERVAHFAPRIGTRAGAKIQELAARPPTLLGLYLLRRELFLPQERRALHDLPPCTDPILGVPTLEADCLDAIRAGGDVNNAISGLELSHYLRHMLLRDADVFSMANGLEVRVPLLDHSLVELALSMPGRWKRSDGRLKPLLIDAVGTRLPSQVERRKKRGFSFPWHAWLVGALHQRARAALADADVWRVLGIRPDGPRQMWDRFVAGDARVAALQIIGLWVLAEFATRRSLLPPR